MSLYYEEGICPKITYDYSYPLLYLTQPYIYPYPPTTDIPTIGNKNMGLLYI